MVKHLQHLIATLVNTYLQGTRLALLFDYDGTLTPLVDHPAQARLEPDVLRVLKRLALRPRIHLGILTGRCLDDIRGLVDIPGLYLGGNCGLELDLQGETLVVTGAEVYRTLVKEVAGRLRKMASEFPGAWIENKEYGLTLHYRHVENHLRNALLERTTLELATYSSRLHCVDGSLALEITPAIGWDKGKALHLILESIGQPVVPLYAGDGANDSDALSAAIALGGVALGIGKDAPQFVHHQLDGPIDVLHFLENLDGTLGAQSAGTMVAPTLAKDLATNSSAHESVL